MNWRIKSKSSSNAIASKISILDRNDLNTITGELRENNDKKILTSLELLLEGQEVTQKDLQLGLIGLAKQNSELLSLNKELNQQLEIVMSELSVIKKERQEKAARRDRWSNRKRLPKRHPINSEIYNQLMKENLSPSYIATRTRIAICLLTVTGIRISELLPLKVGQIETLLKEGWIAIPRLNKGPSNHKAFLTSEGKKLVKARKKDFKFLFAMKSKDSYIFTSYRKPYKMLRRETLTMDVNKVLRSFTNSIESKPNITSHSFRIGYITKLWKHTSDIEFVRQTIGHSTITTTSRYIEHLNEEERKFRISTIN
jgi:integrase